MLRITRVDASPSSVQLRLEGRILGEWVDLLEEQLDEERALSRDIVLDLGGVDFANGAALQVLRSALRGGARLIACSPLIDALLSGDSNDDG